MICNHQNCKKKIKSVFPLSCKCKLYFCKKHKYPETHECTYNYKNTFKEQLNKNNEKIVSDKFVRLD